MLTNFVRTTPKLTHFDLKKTKTLTKNCPTYQYTQFPFISYDLTATKYYFEVVDISFGSTEAVNADFVHCPQIDFVQAVDDQRRDHGTRLRRVIGDGTHKMTGQSPHRRHARRRHHRFALDVARSQTVDALHRTLSKSNPEKKI